MRTGSCGCGAVRYEVTTPFVEMHNCHCSVCRKTHGAAFATYAQTRAEGLRVAKGTEHLRDFESSPVVRRRFCDACGSSLFFAVTAWPDRVWVAAGSLDDDPGIRPGADAFVASKASWHVLAEGLPRFEAYPPLDGDDAARAR